MGKYFTLIALLFCLFTQPAIGEPVQRMDKDKLKSMLGKAGVVVLDVRTGSDWSESTFKIKGAVRAPGKELDTWSADYPQDTTLVLYCA